MKISKYTLQIVSIFTVVLIVFASLNTYVFAKSYKSQETTASTIDINRPMVNGSISSNINYSIEKNNRIKFTYTGDEKVKEWIFVDKDGKRFSLKDLKQYMTVIKNDNNVLYVSISDWAKFKAPDGLTLNLITTENTTKKPTQKKNSSRQSPETGRNAIIATTGAMLLSVGSSIILLRRKNK